MDCHVQGRVSLDESVKGNFSPSSVANDQLNHNINATDNAIGLPIMPRNAAINGHEIGLTFSIAEHMTATDTPTFGSLRAGGFSTRPSSSVLMWTCCDCLHSGMAVGSTGWCPNCTHEQCGYCPTYKGRGY